jgi:pyridoxal phosphate enzyme (YggS family)
MSCISDNYNKIISQLPAHVRLVAVSKFQPTEAINELYETGQRIFGESKAQELTTKHDVLPKDIEWHFIGHLQTNKIKYIAPFVSLVHGIDSPKLLNELNKAGEKAGRIINCLIQVHIAEEESKFGFSFDELDAFFASEAWKALTNIRLCGLMGMATYTDNEQQIRKEFRSLAQYLRKAKSTYFNQDEYFKELSMGMSGDYQIAIEEGSTLVRIGSSIFGERHY